MIESFSVTNFGCFKGTVIFQLSPYKIRVKPDHISDNDCLKTSVVFGGNATGKTTLIRALEFLKNMVTIPQYTTSEPIYNWDLNEPVTSFDLSVNIDSIHYEYHLVVKSKKSTFSPDIDNQYDDLVFKTNNSNPEISTRYSYSIVEESLKMGGLECDRYGNRRLDDVFVVSPTESQTVDHSKEKMEIDSLQSKLADLEKRLKYTIMKIDNIESEIRRYQEIEEEINKVSSMNRADYINAQKQFEELMRNKRQIESTLSQLKHDYDVYKKKEFESTDSDTGDFSKIISEIRSKIDYYEKMLNSINSELPSQKSIYEKEEKYMFRRNEVLKNLDSLKKDLQHHLVKRDTLQEEIDVTLNRIAELRSSFDFENMIDLSKDSVLISKVIQNENGSVDYIKRPELDVIRQWFSSSLIILGTDDFHIPLNDDFVLSKLTKILESFDVGIEGLSWIPVDDPVHEREIKVVRGLISDKDDRRLASCKEQSILNQSLSSVIIKANSGLYLFKYWIGEESVYKLFAYHDHDKREPIDLDSESDGTRRMIEMASILFPTDKDRVFVVDEIDRRLHPNLTSRFIKLFFEDRSKHKQLLFSTHEVGLMTTDLFRMDEIWFTEVGKDGSYLVSLIDLPADSDQRIKFNKRLDKMYMEGCFGGIPIINPDNLDHSGW